MSSVYRLTLRQLSGRWRLSIMTVLAALPVIIAALMVLEQLSITGVPLSELRRPFERYAASGEVNRRVADPAAVIGQVEEAFADGRRDHLDGLTVEYDDWWFNLRPSNTEPLLRLNVEAGDAAACEERTNEVLAIVGGEAD